jgi:hypothetical protein
MPAMALAPVAQGPGGAGVRGRRGVHGRDGIDLRAALRSATGEQQIVLVLPRELCGYVVAPDHVNSVAGLTNSAKTFSVS